MKRVRTYHPLYHVWCQMRYRCGSKEHKDYPYYGARGIEVCARWDSFEHFVSDMGERPPGCSLDRIDNDGDYELANVRWATTTEQANNRRNNRVLYIGNKGQTLSAWAWVFNIPRCRLRDRLKLGWCLRDALTLPKYSKRPT